MMEDYKISEVTKILGEWNPLGDDAERVDDLDGYKTESVFLQVNATLVRMRERVPYLCGSRPILATQWLTILAY